MPRSMHTVVYSIIKTLCFRLGKAELLRAVEREGRVGERRLGAAPRPALLAEIRARRGNLVNYQGTCSTRTGDKQPV